MPAGDQKSLQVLLVNTSDRGGGAESVSTQLNRALAAAGHKPLLAVGISHGPGSERVPNREERSSIARRLLRASEKAANRRGRIRGASTLSRSLRWLAEPIRGTRRRLGHEDFYYPGTEKLLDFAATPIDLVHLHNLHGDYFDLRQLPSMSRRVPTAVTLHDQWLMTGHCAYSLECQGWRSGCGNCPHLDTYPAIPRDATRGNLARKKSIYSESRLYVSAPSQWLLDQIPGSVLSHAVRGVPRLIPNGVDQAVFNPSGRAKARAQLALPVDSRVVTFAANLALTNPYKNWPSLLEALRIVGDRSSLQIFAFAIGEPGKRIQLGNVTVQPVARIDDPAMLADWYRASDVYVQPSRADNHPLTILESLSCGTPVLATAVGGIPEQIRPLASIGGRVGGEVPVEKATGALVPVGDPTSHARCLMSLLDEPSRLARMSENAAGDASERFTLDRYVSDTLSWYRDILEWESQVAFDGWSLPTGTHS